MRVSEGQAKDTYAPAVYFILSLSLSEWAKCFPLGSLSLLFVLDLQ